MEASSLVDRLCARPHASMTAWPSHCLSSLLSGTGRHLASNSTARNLGSSLDQLQIRTPSMRKQPLHALPMFSPSLRRHGSLSSAAALSLGVAALGDEDVEEVVDSVLGLLIDDVQLWHLDL